MREIKFRVWDETTKKMYYTENDGIFPSGTISLSVDAQLSTLFGAKYIPMQYTGLKDKNGKEIYEGDIIEFEFPEFSFTKYPRNIGFVEHLNASWIICSTLSIPRYTESLTVPTNKKVIGNIYENPELLTETE